MDTLKEKIKRKLHWENWPFDLLYFPIGIVWVWLGIKARHFWYFTPVNPSLEFAGFEGGSKRQVYEQLPGWSYPTTVYAYPGQPPEELKNKLVESGITYPFVVKPDTGRAGILFRVIQTEEDWLLYHSEVGEMYLIQEYVREGDEFTVFYIRYPGADKGTITGLVVKDFLQVTGNGTDALETLVLQHPVAKHRIPLLRKRHAETWNEVPASGETILLNPSGNHNAGTRFVNLNHEIDERLELVFDNISQATGQFYYGRYDLKCTSLQDLKEGKNIRILEFNGAGAAIMHVFDRGMSYFGALGEITRHWQHLYRIGKINNQNGVPYLNFFQGWKQLQKAKKNFKRMQQVDVRV